jgi:hypothetical protein
MRSTTKHSIDMYLLHGCDPGHWLGAVLSNSLIGAFRFADSDSQAELPEVVRYLWNDLRSDCWGSRDVFEAWKRHQGEDGLIGKGDDDAKGNHN